MSGDRLGLMAEVRSVAERVALALSLAAMLASLGVSGLEVERLDRSLGMCTAKGESAH